MKSRKKALLIASMASMLDNFNRNNIEILHKMGYEITLAANFEQEDSNSKEKVKQFVKEMQQKGYNVVQIDFSRKILRIRKQIESYKQVKLLAKENFDIIHCHSPICAAITRIVFRKKRIMGTKMLYTAHGFHFFKGAPLKNWLVYYPIEKYLSRFTDVLITINQEDFHRAKNKFHTKKIEYVPGVGIDINKFRNTCVNIEEKRKEFGIKNTDIILLSVGELNKNKNHEVVIRALAKLENKDVHYIIAGQGELKGDLEELAYKLGIQKQVHILGFRMDVSELYKIADIFVFPSKREGLGLAAIEAMACGLPLITSDIHGIKDYSKNGVTGYTFDVKKPDTIVDAIEYLIKEAELRQKLGEKNRELSLKYDLKKINVKMEEIYSHL